MKFGKKKPNKDTKEAVKAAGYDFSTAEAREETVPALFAKAKNARTVKESEWIRYNDYYNFIHDATEEMREFCEEKGVPWTPPPLPDCWIAVESLVDPGVPAPEFRGRDDDRDSAKAKERERAVRFICENNRLDDMNTSNEKRLLKLGDAFWKACWDNSMRTGIAEGDIRIKDIPVECLYFDPAAGLLQEGQFVAYAYRLHKVVFCREYARELKKLGLSPEDLMGKDLTGISDIFDLTTSVHEDDDTVEVLEFWFKQPFDAEGAEAGCVGCSIQVGGRELRYIPNYWKRTWRQNKLFPFVHYWRVRDENEFYNKSELYPILDMVDAADRKLGANILNDAMMGNDIMIVEEGALADGCEPSNAPGEVLTAAQNRGSSIRRLGGLQSGTNGAQLVEFLTNQIQRTNRNYETNLGKEPTRQTTATGLAMLRSDADDQENIKKADRKAGFERLYELLDWLALEFYDTDRLIWIGAKTPEEEPVEFIYNADNYAGEMPQVLDPVSGEVIRESWTYYPRVDVTVDAGDGVIKGKQATLQALEALAQMQVSQQNYKLLLAELDILDIPMKKEIKELWEAMFTPKVPPEVTKALEADPQLLALVTRIIASSGAAGQGMPLGGGVPGAVPQSGGMSNGGGAMPGGGGMSGAFG
jgi:hypothetical protein